MTETTINVDAVFGTEVKVGDVIEIGQKLGADPGSGQFVLSEVKGQVKAIVFDAQDHQFQIIISH